MNETEGWVRQHGLLSILICWLMAGVIGTIAVWIYTGDVYLEIRPPAFSFSGWGSGSRSSRSSSGRALVVAEPETITSGGSRLVEGVTDE